MMDFFNCRLKNKLSLKVRKLKQTSINAWLYLALDVVETIQELSFLITKSNRFHMC